MTKSMETQAFSLRLVQGPRTAKTIAYRYGAFLVRGLRSSDLKKTTNRQTERIDYGKKSSAGRYQ